MEPCWAERLSAAKKPAACAMVSRVTSVMDFPPMRTSRRFLPQPVSVAGEAFGIAAIPAEKDAHVHLVFLVFQVFEKAKDAGESSLPMDDPIPGVLRQFVPRRIGRDAFVGRKLQHAALEVAVSRLRPGVDGAFSKAL